MNKAQGENKKLYENIDKNTNQQKLGTENINHITDKIKAQSQNVYNNKYYKKEQPISSSHSVINTDLGRDNLENDLTSADKQDL